MVKIDIRGTTKETIARFGLEHSRAVNKAQTRALNRTADNLRTEAGREIQQSYKVTLRGIRQASKITYARAGDRFPFTELTFRGRPINLIEFGARPVNPWNVKGRRHNRRGGGVSVQVTVRGGRKIIKNAFIATLKGGQNAGKKGVFRRTTEARYPIRFLPSLSLPVMAERRAIASALTKFAGNRFQINFEQNLRFLTQG